MTHHFVSSSLRHRAFGLTLLLANAAPASIAAQADTAGYVRSTVMIPMRDGVKLNTVVWSPAGGSGALPILLERTPYNGGSWCRAVFGLYPTLVHDRYIFVCQDLRGKFGSEGTFSMIRPPSDRRGAQSIDETTDAYDTVDWLVKNLPNNNGRVGIRGVSYPGWTTMMALVDPHPAVKAASPQASPDDMFLGDDFHHNGAFRLAYGFEYVAAVDSHEETPFRFDRLDVYEWFLRLGGLANVDAKYFHGTKPSWSDFALHPAYDRYWLDRNVSRQLSAVTVPTLTVAGWWDQEDFYGPLTIYRKLESLDSKGINYLVVGPWNHGGWVLGDGSTLGPLKFGSATGQFFRDSVEAKWFGYWLKDQTKPDLPEALTFQVGTNRWERHDSWPPRGSVSKPLYFSASGQLSWSAPPAGTGRDRYVSDPAKPVPYRVRPIVPMMGEKPASTWPVWQLDDQRHANLRPDVLSYETPVLDRAVTVTGPVSAELYAETTGTDADWVVKLIDVYPNDESTEAEMRGYQLMVVGDVFRGRFVKSFEHPQPLTPNRPTRVTLDLHAVDYVFNKGHRIMVQIQSSWFPLIDRNPQTFVPNIFAAQDSDYRVATQTIHRSARFPSHLNLSVVE